MAEKLDPYAAWLGIQDAHRPVTNYQLLGLTPFESNHDAIENGAQQQLAKLAAFLKGENARLAKRIAFEIESARTCLLNPATKAAYDSTLGAREHPGKAKQPARTVAVQHRPCLLQPQASVASTKTPSTAESTFADFLLDNLDEQDVNPPLLPVVHHYRYSHGTGTFKRVALIAGGSIGGLAAVVGVILLIIHNLQSSSGWETKSKDDAVVAQTSNATVPPPQALQSNMPKKSQGLRETPPVVANTPSSSHGIAPLASDTHVTSSDSRVTPVEAMRVAVDLPEFSGAAVEQSTKLCEWPVSAATPGGVKLFNCAPGPGCEAQFQIEPSDDALPDKSWRICMISATAQRADDAQSPAKKVPVATLAVEGNKLTFKWLANARSVAHRQLQNCVLSLRLGDHEHEIRLRRPQVVGPLVLDLDHEFMTIPLDGDCIPDKPALTLQIMSLEQFPSHHELRPGPSVTGNQAGIRIILKNDMPRVEIRVAITAMNDKMVMKIAPLVVDNSEKTLPFTSERFKTMLRVLPTELAEYQATLNNLNTQYVQLQNLHLQTQRGSFNAEAQRVIKLQAIQTEMDNVSKHARTLEKKIPTIQRRLVAIQPLIKLGTEVHKVAKIHLRVFFLAEGKEVEIVKAY
jgi:hypothetical protein